MIPAGADSRTLERERMREALRQSLKPLDGIYPVDRYEGVVKIGKLRRRGARPGDDPTRSLTLIEDENGVLLWEDGAVLARPVAGLRRGYRGAAPGPTGEVVEHVIVEPLDPSKVGSTLACLDQRLTPHPGLRQFIGGKLQLPGNGLKPVNGGRILLIVHGTFSEGQAILDQLTDSRNKDGQSLLASAAKKYDQILVFDHPTMAVSPMLNALDLARRFADTKADIDVICHSRGGLVTRWWLEAFDHPIGKRRAILVGAPLAGTNLASPPRLRHLLSWFSNLNQVIGMAGSLVPFLPVVSCLARLTATVTNVLAQTPLVDAAVAMVPGLAAMSRIDNNFELDRLNTKRSSRPEYYVVKSHFQPRDPGWKFWEYFVDQPLQRAARHIFPGENDLVVDTESMTVVESVSQQAGARKISDIAPACVHDFGATNTVYHTNYFRDAVTCKKIQQWLQL